MYPVLKEGTTMGTFRYRDSADEHCYIENEDGEEFEISPTVWKALWKADGTRPLDLPGGGREMIPLLKELGLVRTSRFVREDGVFNRFVLFPVRNGEHRRYAPARAVNAILPAASVLLFALGIILAVPGRIVTGGSLDPWLYGGMLAASIALHEAGHLAAGRAYGYRINDTGLLLAGIVPIGAYVSYEEKDTASRKEKIQFSLAGIEMNLLLAGLCLITARLCSSVALTMLLTAAVNTILAGLNILPISGLDGESALSALLEVESISEIARRCLTDRRCRREMFRSGPAGFGCACLFALIVMTKPLLYLFIGFHVISAIAGLF